MEIRRIRESEGETVGELWDRMCRETVDGGPLTEQGRRNLSRMLAMSAWHRDAFCLVAVEVAVDGAVEVAVDGAVYGDRLIGFVNGRVSAEAGLLPGVLGEIDSLYVVPEERGRGASKALAGAAVRWLRDRDATTI